MEQKSNTYFTHNMFDDAFIAPKNVFKDPEISEKAKGIYGVILSCGTAKMSDILSCCKGGEKSIRGGIKELMDGDYLFRMEERLEGGEFAGVRYYTGRSIRPHGQTRHAQNDRAVESIPISKSIIKLHSDDSEEPSDTQEKITIPKGAGKLPKTNPKLVPYLSRPDTAEHITDITDEHDIATLRHVYSEDDWQLMFAEKFWKLGMMHNFLTVPQWMKRRLVIQKWADSFDKVIRTRKGTKEQLQGVLRWMVEIDDWWLSSGNFASPDKFHKTCNRNGYANWFEFFISKVVSSTPAYPVERKTYYATDVEKILAWHKDLSMTNFKSRGGDKYMFVSEQRSPVAV